MPQILQDLFRRMRVQFPALRPEHNGGYIHFDNAAGAQLPANAIQRVTEHLTRFNAQKGAVFARQERMQHLLSDLRAACGDLMGTTSDRIALGLNATSLTALIAHHLGRDLNAGELILTSQLDHMANIAPWEEMRTRGVQVAAIPIQPDGRLDMAAFHALLERKPRVVACGWVSNATGARVDLAETARLAHGAGALFFADCVAGAPHLAMDVTAWDVDFAVCSAYKIFGPHLGMAYINPARLGGWQIGQGKLELGTQNHEGAAGFTGTLEYLEMLGTAAAATRGARAPESRHERLLAAFGAIGEYEESLTAALVETLGSVPGVVRYGNPTVPIVSFNFKGHRPAEVARHLEESGIEARAGNYMAVPSMTRLAAEFGGEAVRVSLLHYNTADEVQRLGEALSGL